MPLHVACSLPPPISELRTTMHPPREDFDKYKSYQTRSISVGKQLSEGEIEREERE